MVSISDCPILAWTIVSPHAGYHLLRLSYMMPSMSEWGLGDGMLAQGLALVDHDNFRRPDRRSKAELELDTEILVDEVARTFPLVFPRVRELDVRLYGGWTDAVGLPSRDASWLYEMLPDLRGRRHGLIVRPALATTMIRFPDLPLRGTVRGVGRNHRQKMVDGMIGCDAIHMVTGGLTCVGVVTDDDDLLPAVLFAHGIGGNALAWMRARQSGSAINDQVLQDRGVRIFELGEESP